MFAIVAGVLCGVFAPAVAIQTKPLSDIFIDALRWLVRPIVFCSVTVAIATMGNLRQLGRLGLKAALYFELLTLLTLAAGLAGAWLLQPGAGWHADAIPAIHGAAIAGAPVSLLDTLGGVFMKSPVLQLVLCAIACGIVLGASGPKARRLVKLLQTCLRCLFTLVGWILLAAPLAAFGAIAWTVGHYGFGSIGPLFQLLFALYATTIGFMLVLIVVIGRCCGVSLWKLIVYLKEEVLIVFSTTSSIAAMPKLIEKLQQAGCPAPVVDIVIPAGYSFNLTGSNIYIAVCMGFLAQAYHVELDFARCVSLILVLMVTSKSASGVAGSAFVALTASLAVMPEVPAESMAYLLGIERLLKCRPLANILGNAVACIAVSAWCGQLKRDDLRAQLAVTPAS
ncbi:MAG: cation:dicarboxylase symporter family transporter [Pseudomonadota bacterium]